MSTIVPALRQAEFPTTGKCEKIADCVVAILCTPALMIFAFGVVLLLLTGNSPGHHDVVSYWTAARQLLHHANPYDSAAIQGAELAVGVPSNDQVLLMRNPPWALCLVLPLGVLGVRVGSLLWTLLLLGCFIASVQMIGTMLRERSSQPTRLHLFGYAFAPALLCILTGQSSLFVLLGLVLFLKLHTTRPWLAGSSLYLCALKPHLFLPFTAAFLLWIIASRNYRLLLGFFMTVSTATGVAMWFDPMVWSHYLQMMQTSGMASEFVACPSVALRFIIDPHANWLQYLPAVLGTAWAVRYYTKNRAAWDWTDQGALLLVVSLVVSPYAWVTDQAILISALLFRVSRAPSKWPLRILMLACALIEIQLLEGVTMHSALVLWIAPFWLAWYLVVSPRVANPALNAIKLIPSSQAA